MKTATAQRTQVGAVIYPCFSTDEVSISGIAIAISPLAHVAMRVISITDDGKVWCAAAHGSPGMPFLVRSWVIGKSLSLTSRIKRLEGRESL